ncbi:hypothetical protein SHELI_v1c01960 [Spiroplasma helicoides]|uniref:Uncharacterized protein n=1 Tax=Spiroplasma helicoides TaxID=216938 RepID=A0A1B3SJQ3_9MOLU|nr:hypothetical protein [Spiroplasma helicoides]AOG60151.1 hypothetical protein SHELI_v1c01960 [Spiroplasma helicoides]
MKKFDIKDKVLITGGDDYRHLINKFADEEERFEKKVYGSMTEETRRTVLVYRKCFIKSTLSEVFKTFVKMAIDDLNPNIDINEIEEGCFGITSKKTNNIPFRVTTFEVDSEFEIKWYTKNNAFIRTVIFRETKNGTKMKYWDTTKGMETVFGLRANYDKALYLKNRKITFKIQTLKLKLELEQLNEQQIKKMNGSIDDLTKKLAKYQY